MASTFAIAPARHVRSAADFARGLEAALEARAPGVYASTPLVCELALLDISARIRDIGMIGLPDRVVRSTEPLSPDDWELVNQHPALGAELLAGLPAMKQAQPIVRGHHERWDGGGYPDGHSQENIP